MASTQKNLSRVWEFLFLGYLVSFFLILGSDQDGYVLVRLIFGAVLLAGAALMDGKNIFSAAVRSWPVKIFALFTALIFLRALWGLAHAGGGFVSDSGQLYLRYLTALARWLPYFLFFVLGYAFYNDRQKTGRLLETLSWAAVFIAFNALPSLLQHAGQAFYKLPNGSSAFFFPPFYFHPWIENFLLGKFAHPNYTGDVIALGFFPALGLGLYAFFQYAELKKGSEDIAQSPGQLISYALLRFMFALVMAAAIFLFFSRGTMLTFLLAAGLFFLSLLIKFPSRFTGGLVGGALLALFGFLVWSGSLKGTFEELQTLGQEQKIMKGESGHEGPGEGDDHSSLYVKEGIRRTLAIYRHYPVLGAGTRGYREISKHYADPELGSTGELVNFHSLSHYTQLLAEEGSAAVIYFLFLLVYAFEVLRGLLRTQSRFKFVMAASLGAPLLMISIHAVFNQLLEQFALGLPFHFMMGAALGVLRQDFKHEKAES
jgi:hypothetical protein